MKKSRKEAIEELSLMLMYLTRFNDSLEYGRSFLEANWKGYDFVILDKLEKDELIFQPNKSKICYITEEGKSTVMFRHRMHLLIR